MALMSNVLNFKLINQIFTMKYFVFIDYQKQGISFTFNICIRDECCLVCDLYCIAILLSHFSNFNYSTAGGFSVQTATATMSTQSPASQMELVLFNYVRNNYEKKYKANIPIALKYLMQTFSNKLIPTNLLTWSQDLAFFKLLSSKLGYVKQFELLYRASDYNYSAQEFHKTCDNKGPTFVLVSSDGGNIFGGYTSKSWTNNGHWIQDPEAFLFVIKNNEETKQKMCPFIIEIRKDMTDRAIRGSKYSGPVFGNGDDIHIGDNCNKELNEAHTWMEVNYTNQETYNKPEVNVSGGQLAEDGLRRFKVLDYDVIAVKI